MKTATFGIGGMHCAACAARNERVLNKVTGVLKASVNFATHSARVEFDEAAVSEGTLHDAVIRSGYQVLTPELAQEHKNAARRELQTARRRAFLAFLFTAPVVVLAMFEIELPWSLAGRNLSIWIQGVLSAASSSLVSAGNFIRHGAAGLEHRRQYGHADFARDADRASIQRVDDGRRRASPLF